MNNKIITAATILLLFAVNVQAKILRVNNTGIATLPAAPNTTPIYTTVQAAHDVAVAGDTIHIEPSGVTYGSLALSKRLVIIGNGYFLGSTASNGNPNLQANIAESIISTITVSSGGNLSTIMGCVINSTVTISGVNDLTFKRNYVGTNILIGSGTSSNLKIVQNYITSYFDCGGLVGGSGIVQNSFIQNNFIGNGIYMNADDLNMDIENNICGVQYFVIYNATVRNNIVGPISVSSSLTNCLSQNNICSGALFGNLDGNISSVPMTTVFEDWPNSSISFSQDSRFTLSGSSPAIGAGFGGIDMGIFGGSFPYVVSGIPNVPSIFKLNTPATVTTNTMNVTISTRSNN
jgi:hypothetical protein